MNFIMTVFGWPLGFVMMGLYLVSGNKYALALTLFTFVIKLALLPISIKQQKEQAKSAVFQPKLQAIQKKYGNNRERYNEEVQKLYSEEGFNPMSGCLPTLIQFPILFGIIDVVYKPLYHILRMSNAVIDEMVEIAKAAGHSFSGAYYSQIQIIDIVKNEREIFSSIDAGVLDKIAELDMSLFGLNLGVKPEFALTFEGGFNWYLLIPVLAGVLQLAGSFFLQKSNPTQQGAGAMSIMLYLMPLFSIYIGFIVPAGVGFYWALSAAFQLVQTVFFHYFFNPKKMAEKMEAEMEAEREEKRQKRMEAREKLKELQRAKNAKYDNTDPAQKEINRNKLAEARKRDAEKYGDEYKEVTDDDLR